MNEKIVGLKFQPWVPKLYNDSNNPYGKLLILGESHYIYDFNDNVDYSDITNEVLNDVIAGNGCENINYYRNLGRVFNDNQKFIWEYASFANVIQNPMKDSSMQPNNEDFKTIIPAFWLLVESLKPQKILITSKRIWNKWLPDNDNRSQLVGNIAAEGKESNVWSYKHDDGFGYAIGINHPSKFFSSEKHKPLIEKFIATDFTSF